MGRIREERAVSRGFRRSPVELGLALADAERRITRGEGTGKPQSGLGRRVLDWLVGAAMGCVGGTVILAGVGQFVGAVRAKEAHMYMVTDAMERDLDRRFTYHTPHSGQTARYAELRGLAYSMGMSIARMSPVSREQSLAFTHLEEAVMWANAAIARNEVAPASRLPIVPEATRPPQTAALANSPASEDQKTKSLGLQSGSCRGG